VSCKSRRWWDGDRILQRWFVILSVIEIAMHEMSLAEGVLQLIEDASRQQGFVRCTAVWLEIGQLAGVEVEAMKFCFDAVTRSTLAENARLEVITTPGTGWCMSCATTVPMTESMGACPNCGGYQVQVTGGTEMRVKELEVE
jgi:hydrogenase nickel incorporation protein HypA/HybF